MGTASDMAGFAASLRQDLPATPGARDLIRYATLAANSHNTQAWRFRESPSGIDIVPDAARRTPVVDPDDHHLFISLGGAAENLTLAMAARGQGGEVMFDPTSGSLSLPYGTTRTPDTALFDAIPARQSTRSDYDGTQISPADLGLLAAAATMPRVDLVLITQASQITRLSDLVIAANTAQIADPAFVAELKHWLRFSPRAAMTSGDGLYSAASGSPALPDWLGPRLFDAVFTARSENAKVARQIAASAGIAVFAGAAADPAHWVQVGRASQRFALQATALGLKCAYLNQPVEVADFRAELADLVGLPGRRPDLLMRFGRGPMMPYSARRPVGAVMT
ncbi:nitroreductase family protein [Fertoebacter nigrum]|uniref:Nitroreductase family protein n=1 Tax=Fertoeibacter niger TaxID=2656921 RepID=A0A8X8KM87_9RHOB|nr:nitroreductase family protein [Fertoeibacter niger]NUB46114.1 nitroreductase family protein [Fertoeibacter niger]